MQHIIGRCQLVKMMHKYATTKTGAGLRGMYMDMLLYTQVVRYAPGQGRVSRALIKRHLQIVVTH